MQGIPFLDGLMLARQEQRQRSQDDMVRLRFQRESDELSRQNQARSVLGDLVANGGNDPAKLSALAKSDPDTFIRYQQYRTGQSESAIKQRREAAQFAVDAMGVIEALPPDQRPAAWSAARQQAQAQGYDISSIPENYDPATARMLALRNQNFLKFSENQISTAPGGAMGGWAGGAGGSPVAPPASPTRPVAPFNAPADAGSYFGGAIGFHEQKYGLPPGLLGRVAGVESAYNPNAVSPKGAIGVMQLMPDTAKALGVQDPRNPVQNIDGGARFLKQMLDKYQGDQVLALMAYNWGPGNVDQWIAAGRNPAQVPSETRGYIQKITGGNPFSGSQVAAAPPPVAGQGGPQVAQNAPPGTMSDAGVTPLFKGQRPYTDGLPAGYQWGQNAAGQLVQIKIPGGKPNTREVTLDDGVWLVDNDTGQKVQRIGDRPRDKEVPTGYMRDPADPTKLLAVPGGPADPDQIKRAAEARRRENLKAVPQKVADANIEDSNSIRKIDAVIAQMQVGKSGSPSLPGVGGVTGFGAANLPGGAWLANQLNPSGSLNRALIADIGSLKIHDRSGAAVTASEFPRLAPFIPSPGDSAEIVYQKLINFRREYIGALRDRAQYYNEQNGYLPMDSVKPFLDTPEPGPGDKGLAAPGFVNPAAGRPPVAPTPAAPPQGQNTLPPGAKMVGTYQGKPVVEMPDGKRYTVEQ